MPELLVLRMLSGREMYGYEIVKAMRLVTGEAIGFGEGVVYPVLHSLEENGALKARRKAVNGRERVYYAVTTKGQTPPRASVRRMEACQLRRQLRAQRRARRP